MLPEVFAANHCVILQYHHFSEDTPRSTSVTPREFDAHLDFLEDNRFAVLPLQQVVESLRSKRPLPDKCIAITVDDAYISVYEEAFPRLKKRGWPFTVFVNGEQVSKRRRIFMTWEQMREMAVAGVRFENHGLSHDHLIRRKKGESESEWRSRVENDVFSMQKQIAEELGQKSQFFAYPYGEFDDRLKEVVGSLGFTGFGQQSGPAWTGSDFLALPRFPMAAEYASMASFKIKVNSRPLPVIEAKPAQILLPINDWRPTLILRVADGDYVKDQMRCYVSGQGEGLLKWLDMNAGLLEVRPRKNLNVGRNRYNCTAPGTDGKHYYWYSHTWIRRHQDGSWYEESE